MAHYTLTVICLMIPVVHFIGSNLSLRYRLH
ncbi:hypothetical protein SEUBUCD646_0C00780 [Saccharomyces eubayanus]|uniref:Uncharacterized protein n=1 Tax=Saccharomyces eubayanus TaxID=1080349 RepID=A0ABN8VWB0_SACEU|nr:hypothetical protein SEUBUCD650_0C00740 [Saccharomyces eubayanus]CAI1907965.1 hypothetical protein SEUBUCD646_0C00780 [Saccharomyces eubayanus]